MKRVGIAELKNNLSKYLRAVESGEQVDVADRDRVIAQIVPVRTREPITIRPASRPFAEIRDRTYPPLALSIDVLELLRQERHEREH